LPHQHANGFRQLELAARRNWHFPAGAENALVESPAIHADVISAVLFRTPILTGLLHDSDQITTSVNIQ
jgi:hypothetical protein